MNNKEQLLDELKEASRMIRSGRSRDAIPILDCVIDGLPEKAWALAERGRAKKFIGDYEGAIADFSLMMISDSFGYLTNTIFILTY